MALVNRKLSGIETIFLMSDDRLAHVSSSLIRQLANYDKVKKIIYRSLILFVGTSRVHSKRDRGGSFTKTLKKKQKQIREYLPTILT